MLTLLIGLILIALVSGFFGDPRYGGYGSGYGYGLAAALVILLVVMLLLGSLSI